MNKVCRRGFVSGRVQGVFFRAFTREQALAHGVTGWAENRPDGRVAFLLCGESEAVAAVEAALHEGPPRARVTTVEARDCDPVAISGFQIR